METAAEEADVQSLDDDGYFTCQANEARAAAPFNHHMTYARSIQDCYKIADRLTHLGRRFLIGLACPAGFARNPHCRRTQGGLVHDTR